MVFTTSFFLFIFFPIAMLSYFPAYMLEKHTSFSFLHRYRVSDIVLIVLNLGFYAWTCFDDLYKLCFYIVTIYLVVLFAERRTKTYNEPAITIKRNKVKFITCIALVLAILFYYKYYNFTVDNIKAILELKLKGKTIIAPLGISFITFSAISYIVDVVTGKAKHGSFIDFVFYITFFPKIVSGPIVLWQDFAHWLPERHISFDSCLTGINRIIIGFAKKLILADIFGLYIHDIESSGALSIDCQTAWLGALLYMLQIYYDFAGYSDIAIGLAKILGFDFKENFNFPYLSKSINEFWRRWHISLGAWFREYVYIPLGGSHINKKRTLLNLAVVFALTGIWHGANWTYILWGCINGVMVIFERMVEQKCFYRKTPTILKWLFSMFVTMICWELFRFNKIADFREWVSVAVQFAACPIVDFTWQYFLDFRLFVLMTIGILGATAAGSKTIQKFMDNLCNSQIGIAVYEGALLCIFAVSILCMINSTYSPFIYFQY